MNAHQAVDKVVIFDGVCGLCNHSVNLLITLDRQKQFSYTPLQGEFVKKLAIDPNVDSIIYYEAGLLYYKSTAILKIMQRLGGVWHLGRIFYLLPRPLRDWLYDQIARHRYRIFGEKSECRIPSPEEKQRFID